VVSIGLVSFFQDPALQLQDRPFAEHWSFAQDAGFVDAQFRSSGSRTEVELLACLS
jgi:hypothetical protein